MNKKLNWFTKHALGGFLKNTGQWLGNYGKGVADAGLSTVGMSDVISDDAYKGTGSKLFKGISDVTEVTFPIAAQVAAGTFGGPAGMQAMSATQAAGSNVNSGIVDNRTQAEIEEEQRKYAQEVEAQNIKNHTVESKGGYFAYGGSTKNKYEAETKEVIIGDANIEGTKLASDVKKIGGETHENGGTMGSGGDFIYSDRIKTKDHTGKKRTFAELAEKAGKVKGKMEEKLSSNDIASKNTAERMIKRADDTLANLAVEQESMKKGKGSFAKMAGGGPIGDDNIRAEQERLKQLGYYDGKVDGDWGPNSQAAATRLMEQQELLNVPVNPILPSTGITPKDTSLWGQAKPTGMTDAGKTAIANNKIIGDAPAYPNKVSTTPNFNSETAPTAPNKMSGSDVASNIGYATSLVDNVSAALTKPPKIKAPRYNNFVPAEARVNINPQLNAITQATNEQYANIDNNVLDSNSSRSNKQSAFAKRLDAESSLYGTKDNVERSIRNQNTAGANAMNISNNALTDQFNEANLNRRLDIQKGKQANWANLATDAQVYAKDKLQTERDLELYKTINAANPNSAQYLQGIKASADIFKEKGLWDIEIKKAIPGTEAYKMLVEYGNKYGHTK